MTRVHWFSPLLPDATDIGHFTGRVLLELAKHCEVTLWTETQEPDRAILPDIEIRTFDPTRPDYSVLNRGAIVYNLGNNGPFHAGILAMSQRVRGTVILHEADLQGLFLYVWLKQDRTGARYINYMRRTYGPLAECFAKARLRGIRLDDLAYKYPVVQPALTNAIGVISHTNQVTACAFEANLPCLQLNLPFSAGEATPRRIRLGPIRLVQFGYLNPHRKLDEIFDAIHRHPSKNDFRFTIFGQLWNAAHVMERIRSLGLQEIVDLKGFVDEASLDQAIADADLVFNMRFPTIGEASGTQLRVWRNGAPSVVTKEGWFGDLPDDAVLKISHGDEANALAEILDKLKRDRQCFDGLAARGKEVLRASHDPGEYAKSLLAFVNRLQF